MRHEFADHGLDGRERQRTLQVVEPQAVADGPQVLGRDATSRCRLEARLRRVVAKRIAGTARRAGSNMCKAKFCGKLPAYGDAAHAVALGIQARRENADANAPGLDGENPATYAAFRRQARLIQPFAREIVHAARRHHRQDIARRTCSSTARIPVTGFTPPLASVAPIMARSRQVTRIEHCRK